MATAAFLGKNYRGVDRRRGGFMRAAN